MKQYGFVFFVSCIQYSLDHFRPCIFLFVVGGWSLPFLARAPSPAGGTRDKDILVPDTQSKVFVHGVSVVHGVSGCCSRSQRVLFTERVLFVERVLITERGLFVERVLLFVERVFGCSRLSPCLAKMRSSTFFELAICVITPHVYCCCILVVAGLLFVVSPSRC
jgi:hypothetical protein